MSCRSWTLSWRCVKGLPGKQVMTAEERKQFPDGCLLISTSDREVDSPCESNIPSSMPHCSHGLHCKHYSYQGFSFYLHFASNIQRHRHVNDDISYAVSVGTIAQTLQARWSLPPATPSRRAGFSSPFTLAGLCTTHVTSLSSHVWPEALRTNTCCECDHD